LVKYVPSGENHFWLNFADNDTKLLIEPVEVSRNKREMIEVAPPEKTEEEKKAEEEAKAAAAAAAAKPAKGQKVVTPAAEDEKPPEPIFEEAPENFLDGIFGD
jgi:hypothetical protein